MDNTKYTDDELKKKLSDKEFEILRKKGTKAPFSGDLLYNKSTGKYVCKVCGNELFSSDTKFDSGSGWPSFFATKAPSSVKLIPDNSLGMKRTEVVCANCGSHLGHLFHDVPDQRTGDRFCINSAALNFKSEGDKSK
ncbi:MAG TPA: peptide-methionine (R)-S-oxide reductase MsrB [Candidatus Saccharimonadales bacterium]|nr:peptide-methionine (R)-S-oxide reductase MsrB [Candidatus Saccharimonadales bacterium]